MSGLFVCGCCCGRTRYREECNGDNRFCAFFMNLIIGLSQFATIILCLVGWCWSIGWGITLISVSSKLSFFFSFPNLFYQILMVNLVHPTCVFVLFFWLLKIHWRLYFPFRKWKLINLQHSNLDKMKLFYL